MADRRILARRFETQRPRLVAIASHLLGSTSYAEDVVQEAWLRLDHADIDAVENLDAWLTTVVSRLSLDQLRAPRRTRERSWQVEPWREPVADSDDPEAAIVSNDRVTVALMLVLETLSPAERLAFVLHDVFGLPFAEIAGIVGKSQESVRQLASRGRRRIRGAQPSASIDRSAERSVVQAWLAAVEEGNFEALLGLLADGAVLQADYGEGGERVRGARAIAERAMSAARLAAHSTLVRIDGRPGVLAVLGGRIASLMAFDIRKGEITGVDVLADPVRLRRLTAGDVLGPAES